MILLLPCAAFAQQNNSYWPLFQSYHFNNEAYHPSAATFNQGHNLYSAYQSRAGLFKEIRDLYFNFEFAVNPQNRTGIVAIIMQEGDYISRNRIGAQHAVSISLNTKSRLNLGIYLGAINQVYSASLSSPRVSGTVLDSKMNLAFQSNSLTISLSLNQFNNPKMHLLTSLDNDPSITFKSNLELLTKYHRVNARTRIGEVTMTKFDQNWVRHEEEKRQWMAENGLYRDTDEHASCGVGLVVAIDGKKSRKVVENGIDALKAVWHRGAVDADGKTGDGAGIHVQIPMPFFYDQIERTGHTPDKEKMIAVGQVFLPRTDFGAQETCRTIVETEVLRMGYYIYGWRHVPVNVDCLGEKANATRPEIEQILISNIKGVDEETFERELYVIRRRIEKAAAAAQVGGLYICSLSCRSIIYKGMMLAEQVAEFYPDLMDERFESAFAIYHQRYSTNTFPQWWLAQPFRMLAHNGEINTLKGNLNWMKSHEIRMASGTFGDMADDIKPIVAAGSSDSAALDSVFEVLVRAGRSAPMAKTMLVPESWSKQAVEMPQAWQDMYSYCNSVMEPWDGPAALAMTDGRWVVAGLDRNGLRPMRYVVTGDGLMIAGSEAGMVPTDEATVREKGALGPGQMIGVHMGKGQLFHDAELKDKMSAALPFGEWVGKITDLEDEIKDVQEQALFSGSELRKRQIAAGYSMEDLEQILAPMAEDGKETLASMGDDTPSAVLSKQYRPLSHFFRQNFSQVTNPPIDSLREYRVMSLKTRFGNLKNVLDEDSSQTEILVLDSPFVGNAQFDKICEQFNADMVTIDCTFPAGSEAGALRTALKRIRSEAEDAVRSGAGHIVLTDQEQSAEKVGMPMILATSAVHAWLTQKGLRTFCSLNVRSAECMDPHYFAVLVGCGATTVNAYLAEDSLADRIDRVDCSTPL